MSAYKLGGNGRIYVGGTNIIGSWPTSGASTGLTLLRHVGDVKLNMDKGKEDATTRDTPGFESYFAALIAAGVDFQVKYDPTDPGYSQIESNFFSTNGQTLQVAVLDSDKTTVGAKGLWMDAQVFKFEKGEPVKGIQTVDVNIAPALGAGTNAIGPSWVTVA